MITLCHNCTHDVLAVGVVLLSKRGINVMEPSIEMYYFLLADANFVIWWESYQAMGIRCEV